MSQIELTQDLLARIAGWEVVKQARELLATGKVRESDWSPPLLKGLVQEGGGTFRAGLIIKDAINVDNFCPCRPSRTAGIICAHSVAIGLHFIRVRQPLPPESAPAKTPDRPGPGRLPSGARPCRRIQRVALPPPGSELAGRGGEGIPRAAGGRSVAALPPADATAAPPARAAPPGRNDRATPPAGTDRGLEPGVPAEIHIIFPPNLSQAIAKGKVMLVFESEWSGGRCPLNSLPLSTKFQFSEQDAALLDKLEEIAGGDTPGLLLLPTAGLAGLLPLLAEHPRLTLGKSQSLCVTSALWRVPVVATLEASGEITLRLGSDAGSSSAFVNAALFGPGGATGLSAQANPGETTPQAAAQGAAATAIWAFHQETLQPLALPAACHRLLRGPMRLLRTEVPAFLNQDWPILEADCAVEANFRLEDFSVEPRPPRFRLELAGGLAHLQAKLQCSYGGRVVTLGAAGSAEAFWSPDPDSPTRYSMRDLSAEQTAQARLFRAGFTGPHAGGHYQLAGENLVLNFFAREFPRLQQEWQVTLEERLQETTSRKLERVEPAVRITASGEQWFDLQINLAASTGERLSAADLQRLILSGQSHTKLKNGRIALIDTGAVEEFQQTLLDCAPSQDQQGYRLSNVQSGYLEATLRQSPGWKLDAPPVWRTRAQTQSGATRLNCPPLGDLEAVLRPYQKQGVAWLHFLRQNEFGGILADEMGLGKTLQTLAYLRTLASDQQGQGAGSALVVCPTSLVFNWAAEASRFTPGLRVLLLQGPERHTLFARIPESDLVVTSYALLRRDAELYAGLEFDTVVLDEAQHIKNRETQNAQAVKSIRARHRFVLTGTPLENSVLDLWSIFDFLMPGYLGAAQDFRERYELPIARDQDEAVQARLARRVRPFLLRRLKREVAPELPERLEQVCFCELTEDQGAVYRDILEASRREVLQAVTSHGMAKSRMVILTALLRLRQVCCDLRLLNLADVKPATASGKVELFSELLEEVLDGGHRVLVFSQFVSMLTLLREKLTGDGVGFCYLDGATPDRAAVVNRFQARADIPVFLISLKAGGTGLNLAAADTVIHFDPWWNPAVEAQATDRAHRIGQQRVVTSYKLITRGTVEEKILALQQRKRGLIEAALGAEEQLVGALTWEEIQGLFAE